MVGRLSGVARGGRLERRDGVCHKEVPGGDCRLPDSGDRDSFMDNLLVRIHLIIEMTLSGPALRRGSLIPVGLRPFRDGGVELSVQKAPLRRFAFGVAGDGCRGER